jgi:hypothetical protein
MNALKKSGRAGAGLFNTNAALDGNSAEICPLRVLVGHPICGVLRA